MTDSEPDPFRYDADVDPGEKHHIRYEIGETYLGDPVEMPVTVVNGTDAEIDRGEFDGYRMLGLRWLGDGEEAE